MVKDFIMNLDKFENQFDELVILNPHWSISTIFSTVKSLGAINVNNERKIKFLKKLPDIKAKLEDLLGNLSLIPQKFGG